MPAQLCLTFCDSMDCSLPDFSFRGIFQARILEWVAISCSGDLTDPGMDPTFPALAGIHHCCATWEAQAYLWMEIFKIFISTW